MTFWLFVCCYYCGWAVPVVLIVGIGDSAADLAQCSHRSRYSGISDPSQRLRASCQGDWKVGTAAVGKARERVYALLRLKKQTNHAVVTAVWPISLWHNTSFTCTLKSAFVALECILINIYIRIAYTCRTTQNAVIGYNFEIPYTEIGNVYNSLDSTLVRWRIYAKAVMISNIRGIAVVKAAWHA